MLIKVDSLDLHKYSSGSRELPPCYMHHLPQPKHDLVGAVVTAPMVAVNGGECKNSDIESRLRMLLPRDWERAAMELLCIIWQSCTAVTIALLSRQDLTCKRPPHQNLPEHSLIEIFIAAALEEKNAATRARLYADEVSQMLSWRDTYHRRLPASTISCPLFHSTPRWKFINNCLRLSIARK